MKPGVQDLILKLLGEHGPLHPYGIYQKIRRDCQRKVAYSTIRWNLLFLCREGVIRRLTQRETRGRELQVQPDPSGRSQVRPPINRSYYLHSLGFFMLIAILTLMQTHPSTPFCARAVTLVGARFRLSPPTMI